MRGKCALLYHCCTMRVVYVLLLGEMSGMSFEIGLAQTVHPKDGDVVGMVKRYAEQARMYGVDLLVFPEALMTPFEKTPEEYRAIAEPVGGAFSQAIAEHAKRYGIWILYTMLEEVPEGKQPYNTAVLVDDKGKIQTTYRKTHLFDTDTIQESERITPGKNLHIPTATPFGKIGIGICYDLRFPELARKAALEGCDVMIYTAAWLDGPRKADHWKSLLRARAIENEFFVVGLSRCDSGYLGRSLIVNPFGEVIEETGPIMDLVVATIDLEEVAEARAAMPVLDHVRNDLY